MASAVLLTALNAGAISVGTASTITGALAALPAASSVLAGAGAVSAIQGGMQQSASLKAQAKQTELSARQEELKGRQQATVIRENLQRTLAAQNAAFGARGISSVTGSPVVLASQSATMAGRDIETSQFNTGISVAEKRIEAGQLRVSASAAKREGFINAATTLGGSLLR